MSSINCRSASLSTDFDLRSSRTVVTIMLNVLMFFFVFTRQYSVNLLFSFLLFLVRDFHLPALFSLFICPDAMLFVNSRMLSSTFLVCTAVWILTDGKIVLGNTQLPTVLVHLTIFPLVVHLRYWLADLFINVSTSWWQMCLFCLVLVF